MVSLSLELKNRSAIALFALAIANIAALGLVNLFWERFSSAAPTAAQFVERQDKFGVVRYFSPGLARYFEVGVRATLVLFGLAAAIELLGRLRAKHAV